jgi:diguanylate cyclase (GGDEF)-like protein/PAS domain S-box-containing protein
MSALHWTARLYIAIVIGAALASAVLAGAFGAGLNADRATLALVVAALMLVAWLFPLPLSFKTHLYFDLSVSVAAMLLFQPVVAIVATGAGAALAQLIRRQPWDQTLFNASLMMLQTAAGVTVLAAVGWQPAQPNFDSPWLALALLAAGALAYLVNQALLAGIVGLQTGVSPARVWRDGLVRAERTEQFAMLAQLGLGIAAAELASAAAWTVALLALPTIAVHSALSRNLKLRRQTEAALHVSEANLAEAQRVARLGSWDWNLSTGEQSWSDEVYRIFGLTPRSFGPTYAAFLGLLPADERETVDRVVHDALYDGESFSLDHRIAWPDGSERIVHQQGEVVFDDEGRKARMVGTIHDITERKALEAQLAYRAFHDSLTGLANRAQFLHRLGETLVAADRSDRSERRGAVLFLDLDRFKQVNDSYGHDAGDQLLVAVARRLVSCVPESATVARLGGDEFTILLDGVGRREAERVAERIVQAFAERFRLDGRLVTATTSIGIVLADAQHATATDLLRDADRALYRAKDAGRAGYAIAEAA